VYIVALTSFVILLNLSPYSLFFFC